MVTNSWLHWFQKTLQGSAIFVFISINVISLSLIIFFFSSYVWKHVRYPALISRQPGLITQYCKSCLCVWRVIMNPISCLFIKYWFRKILIYSFSIFSNVICSAITQCGYNLQGYLVALILEVCGSYFLVWLPPGDFRWILLIYDIILNMCINSKFHPWYLVKFSVFIAVK